MTTSPFTTQEYSAFQEAYSFFNAKLFNNELPDLLITLQRHAKAKGYFAPNKFSHRSGEAKAHELAMNPDTFAGRTDKEIFSTLLHEMVHVWQEANGTAPRRCYHNKQFAAKMKEAGLQCSNTGEVGGKEVGQKMTHYVISGGSYDALFTELQPTLSWQSEKQAKGAGKAKKDNSKTKFTCPICELNAWAKPDAKMACFNCSREDGLTLMQPAE